MTNEPVESKERIIVRWVPLTPEEMESVYVNTSRREPE